MTRIFLALLAVLIAGAAAPPPPLDRLQRADGALVVPDRFLRTWDPLTVFFDHDAGPAAGGSEDAPERLVTLDPPQPGAWTWLDARTLQFRPSEPWTPLRRETVTVGARSAALVPLLPTPVATAPEDDPAGIADLDTFALTFAAPVDRTALARLLTIELRPLPGISAAGAQPLTAEDFDIKAVDRSKRDDRQTYLVVLHTPVPDGRMAILRLRLSDAPGLDDPTFELRLRSAAPFAVTDVLCADGFDHDTQDGVIRCTPDDSGQPGPRGLSLQFSGAPEAMDIVRARQALPHIAPGRRPRGQGAGQCAATHRPLRRRHGVCAGTRSGREGPARPVSPGETVPRRFAFASSKPALRWDASQGIVERFGPQMVPLRGHGYARADIRIHAIDPLSRDFWPFPTGVVTQDDAAPPLPGREPEHWTDADAISRADIQARLGALGSPAASDLVDLPIRRGGVDAKFGIDLAPLLGRVAGSGQPAPTSSACVRSMGPTGPGCACR